jgi:hypothetical protein
MKSKIKIKLITIDIDCINHNKENSIIKTLN